MYIYTTTKLLQPCPTLCDPIDGSPPGSTIPGILQAKTLEWIDISFCTAWKWKVKVKLLSRVRFFATPWTAAHQAPLSMGFSRQENWSGVPLPFPVYIYIDTWYVTVYVLISTCTFIFPPASTFPLVGLNLYSKSGIQFPFHKLVHLYPLFCFTSMRSHRIFAFLSLI